MQSFRLALAVCVLFTPIAAAQTYYQNDFESDTVGAQPGGSFIFSPSTNNSVNGAVIIDATSTPANPLSGKSLYVYDLGGSSGQSTHMRTDFNGGTNVSNLRVDFDFQRAFASALSTDTDTRIHFSVGRAGVELNSSANRPFEIRMLNNGDLVVNYWSGSATATTTIGSYNTTAANRLSVLINSHDTLTVDYSDPVFGTGTLQPNTFIVVLNGTVFGPYAFIVNAQNFQAENNDLGRFAFYQDTSRQGGIAFDNLSVRSLVTPTTTSYLENGFETDTVGSQPVGDITFSPSTNSAVNGAVVIDATSTPANPLSGKSLYVYDLGGSSGQSTHMRANFNGGTNVSNVRADFNFQRAFAPALSTDTDTRVHFALGRTGISLNSSANRPFEVRVLNNGEVVVNSWISGASTSTTIGTYNTTGSNHLAILANSHDASPIDYFDTALGSLTVPTNAFFVFLNGTRYGPFEFVVNGQNFQAENNDLGQYAFYQDTSRQGGIVFDNFILRSLSTVVTGLATPTGLTATASSPVSVTLAWADNASGETAYVIERKSGSGEFATIAEIAAESVGYVDTSALPETAYTYRVKATTATLQSATSNEASATTPEQVTPLIVSTTVPGLVVAGTNTTVSVGAFGRAPLSYQWYTGASGNTGSPIAGATSATLQLNAIASSTSVWVRVTNSSGTADSVAVTVTVRAAVTTIVQNSSALSAAIATAGPGDTILLADGVWQNQVILLTGTGSATHPITVGAQTPGGVLMTGASRVEIGGSYLVLRDLIFSGDYSGNDDEVIQFRRGSSNPAHNCRITNITILDYIPAARTKMSYVGFYGTNNRMDHCYFSGHNVIGVTVVIWLDGNPNFHRIDHNHIANRISGGGENGWETIRIGDSATSMQSSHTTVEYNLFTKVHGEIELISNKSGDNVYRYNTFDECEATLTLRHGNRCTVDSNYFLGRGRSNTGGVRVIGEDHIVTNNYFEGTTARDGAAITVYAGVPNSPLNEYFAAHRATISHNTFVDNQGAAITIAAGFGSRSRTVLPIGVVVANNILARSGSSTAGYVIGESPESQTWAANIVHNGTPGFTTSSGFVTADPGLTLNALRQVHLPSPFGPVIGAASGTGAVTMDIEGRARGARKDIGAHQVSSTATSVALRPISTDQTGPTFASANRKVGVPNARLVNGSVRGVADTGNAVLINGFVVSGSASKSILVRAMGPGLAQFGVVAPMQQPALRLFNASGTEIATNTNWQTGPQAELTEAAAFAGAFPFQTGMADSAVVRVLAPGSYTAHISPAAGSAGVALVETYDLTQGQGTMTNQSVRGEIRAGQEVLITGIVIAGTSSRRVLIRCAGPALVAHGVTRAISNPYLRLYNAASAPILENDNWSAGTDASAISAAATAAGAFAFDSGSSDAAILTTLAPGLYSAHGTGVAGATGTALVEVYLLDI